MLSSIFRLLALVLLPMVAVAQPAQLMAWNLLNFSTSSSNRVPYYQTVIDSMQPAILVVQEVQGPDAANYFHTAVLGSSMAMAPFVDGYDTDNALYFDASLFEALATEAILTTHRDITQFKLRHHHSGDTLRIFSVHLKAGSGGSEAAQRAREVDSLRTVTDALPPNAHFIVCGDFNIYGSSEAAYQRLLQDDGTGGHFMDPISLTGTWNNAANAAHHTQSPRTRSFGGGATGGMDDRFDMILFSEDFSTTADVEYMDGSTWAVGNDGLHYNDSINRPPNAVVSQTMADALHYAADHLPVVATIHFHNTLGLESAAEGRLQVYPNPSQGLFTLELSNSSTCQLRVTDALGRSILTANAAGRYSLNLAQQPAGLYLLSVLQGDVEQKVVLVKE
jgi:endonuclease/exonuclease/phosphatase family metal-dependent hydrolase